MFEIRLRNITISIQSVSSHITKKLTSVLKYKVVFSSKRRANTYSSMCECRNDGDKYQENSLNGTVCTGKDQYRSG